jgi:threonine/homoserine/homoserine lactone efflux protein
MTFVVFAAAVAMGVFAAIAPIGPVTILVIRRALAGDWRGSWAVGLGRIPPETVYCTAATFGTATLIEELPTVRTVFEVLGMLILIGMGIWFAAVDHEPDPDSDVDLDDERRRGDWAGFFISAVNPTLILSWSALVGVGLAVTGLSLTLLQKILFPLGVASGIALGYILLIWTLRRFGEKLNHTVVSWTIRLIGVGFVILAIWHGFQMSRTL